MDKKIYSAFESVNELRKMYAEAYASISVGEILLFERIFYYLLCMEDSEEKGYAVRHFFNHCIKNKECFINSYNYSEINSTAVALRLAFFWDGDGVEGYNFWYDVYASYKVQPSLFYDDTFVDAFWTKPFVIEAKKIAPKILKVEECGEELESFIQYISS